MSTNFVFPFKAKYSLERLYLRPMAPSLTSSTDKKSMGHLPTFSLEPVVTAALINIIDSIGSSLL